MRFAREVAAARRASGYHLLPVVDHDTEGPRPWFATHYVPGLPLEKPPAASYTELFRDKPLTLRTPSGLDHTYVDLDAPLVDPTRNIDSDDRELNASYDTQPGAGQGER
ncbi:hypothetical protein GCM10015535_39830 [Streptomyces gelaticus]|uniref:ATP-grasp-modified RiPP n=1 Tax=Streptomyces gelaticus TaxID=285446 RepID=A0ABQ2W3F2_9ACTN|nr:hypothetical protein [Streptomyces gelaticus]GGV88490.1 hypothetical protein GCM10015535_39830 [Streptomyces gelaticus]